MVSHPILRAVIQYAGFFLVCLLFSEEFRRLVAGFREVTERRPRLKVLFYPLAALLALLITALIANSFLSLFIAVLFSYD